ncbi:bifunctional 4-hydroxy-3-methylbut-2-enyl diphosphate reductase/30S ribosomal protein S1 [Clostridium sp. YIM B02505]|uniref:4-hydroxy-3-methylbut-2-enyl diphosphate reductase n=1 Tax=Clostridium yunnanense TaxID=2800325 RepID=A0ABS1EL84_9CLOT|nr:bifunctional 4-hydroxy-3-methylbut-2-enyl diphosphate reductase/30S ribosomal protein S1 [Clostridium yunnanense]MBK1810136.1 bifunctional 4-hydroxy-3-methylbut-2-enyl diphosphate reductase/30S ribosomal protein S1 [Clostridium yunnanense]
MREILLAESAGFCFGVKRAVDETLKVQKQYNKKIFTIGPLIHNNDVVKMLENNNIFAINISDIDSLANDDVVVIRSHGVPKDLVDKLNDKGLTVVNATCPYVTNIQKKVNKYHDEGYNIIIVGDKDHPEVVGINGWCNNEAMVTKSGEFNYDLPKKICIVSQTTEKKSNWDKALNVVNEKSTDVLAFNTICSATDVRQRSAEEISKKVDAMIVIGGKNSSNTTKLFQICRSNCENTIHIENIEDLPEELLNDNSIRAIGVTAGASTPDWIIKEVIDKMTMNNSEYNEQLELMGKSTKKIHVGEILKGEILSIVKNELIVAIDGYKADGVIPNSEISVNEGVKSKLSEHFKVGELVDAKVLRLQNEEGYVVLSRIELEKEKAFDETLEAFNNGTIVTVKVTEVVNGGVVATFKGLRVFIPASQLDIRYTGEFNNFVGKEIEVKFIEVEKERYIRIVASRRVLLEQEKHQREQDALDSLNVGDIVDGTVRRFTNFGAFVEVNGIDGLVHISEISWGKIYNPSDVLKVGEKIKAKVIALDVENKKVSLSVKALVQDPWMDIEEKYPEGSIVLGKVARLNDFGAFLELEPGVDGLAHISKISFNKINHPSEVLKVGELVKARIIKVEKENKRIGLSIKDV